MVFLIAFAVTVAACFALRNPIKKTPSLFYGLSVAMVILYFASFVVTPPRWIQVGLTLTMGHCFLPFAMFAVVMYIGIFPYDSKVRHWLQPVRGPLSIMACFLALGHMIQYLMVYAPRVIAGNEVSTNVLVSFFVAVLLFALIVVLGVTSFEFVKKHMAATTWKKVQQLAYLFYAATYVHLAIMLMPAALHGSSQAQVSLVIYTVVFGVYLIARVVLSMRKKGTSLETAASEKSGGVTVIG